MFDESTLGISAMTEGPNAFAPRIPTLVVRGKHVSLRDGRHFIGRSSACQVVVEDKQVSRKHARVDVFGEDVTILDLGSANGVKRNGKTLPQGPQPLYDGDLIRIGREQLHFKLAPARRPGSQRSREATRAPPTGDLEPAHDDEPSISTRLSNGVHLVLEVGERALDAGNVDEAEEVTRNYLSGMLRSAGEHRPVEPGTYSQCTSFALRLARMTGKGKWLDYAIEMLRLRTVPCSEALAERLRAVLREVDRTDVRLLEEYAQTLRAGTPDLERLRAARAVEGLIADALHRPVKL